MNTTQHSAHPTLLITGATGTIGSEICRQLARQNTPFRAMVRSLNEAQALAELPGAQLIEGDFNKTDTVARALRGIDRTFLLTNSSELAEAQQLSFVAEARRADVKHVIKLSQLSANVGSPVRFLRYHAVVEQSIREAGLNFTFLRPNLFMQGLLHFRDVIARQGQFFAAIGDAQISLIDIRDIAAVAVAALTESGHGGKTYTLTGPQALTHSQLADQLSTALNRPITFVNISPGILRETLLQTGFPAWQADGLVEDYAHYSRKEAAFITPDVQHVTGRLPRPFAEFARDYAGAFTQQ